MSSIPQTSGDGLLERYSALLLDAYGVLVHTGGPMRGAAAFLDKVLHRKIPYFILTNDASKQPDTASRRYRSFGLPIPAERIITSGGLLAGYFRQHGLEGARCAVLGPADTEEYVRQAGGEVVPPGAPFEVLVSGDEAGFDFVPTVDAVLSQAFRQLDRGDRLHLLLPNPDRIYPRGDGEFGFAAGAIAALIEAALEARYRDRRDLRFTPLGKPHAPMFREALRRLGPSRPVMIGDQPETDIRGARAVGIDTVLVIGGVFPSPGGSALESLPEEMRPTWWLPSLAK
ncbi:MAG: HAD-IA family hydrolase [Armatimonadetes bacterium]|nr:HAD-IA family hydrolase [Armatimonadota bacterium]